MKKFLFSLCALLAVSAATFAQGQTATLQQGDKMTPFYGPDAFVQAYNAAQKGAVITLSAGNFNTVDSITKQVTIIGNGCVNTGKTNRTYLYGDLIIHANNVIIEGVKCSKVYIRNVSNTHLKRCYISILIGTHTHINTVVDQCYIADNEAAYYSENMCFKNSIVDYSYQYNSDYNQYGKRNYYHPIYFCNCLIYHWYSFWSESGVTQRFQGCDPHWGTYKNCILGQRTCSTTIQNSTLLTWNRYCLVPGEPYPYYTHENMEFYNNVFFLYPYKWVKDASGVWVDEEYDMLKTVEMNMDTWLENQTRIGNTSSTWNELFDDDVENWWEKLKQDLPYKGDDGTVVGPYGGTGFSIAPSIPRIVESKIDSNTDADGKLNVKIKVEVNQ